MSAGPARDRGPGAGVVWLHLLGVPLLLALAAVGVETTGGDLAVASRAYRAAEGFVGSSLPWMDVVGHRGARLLPIGFGVAGLALTLLAWWRPGLARWRQPALLATLAVLLITLVINVLKPSFAAHCPYQLEAYGGAVDTAAAEARPLWLRVTPEGGDCLPSAHAGGGYTLLALYFAGWLAGSRALRWGGLAAGIGSGLLFSAVRVSQGAHFVSQTLWSAALAWTVCTLLFLAFVRWRRRRAGHAAPS